MKRNDFEVSPRQRRGRSVSGTLLVALMCVFAMQTGSGEVLAQNTIDVVDRDATGGSADVSVEISAVTEQDLTVLSFDVTFDRALCGVLSNHRLQAAGRTVAEPLDDGDMCPDEGRVRFAFFSFQGSTLIPAGSGPIARWVFDVASAADGVYPLALSVAEAREGPLEVPFATSGGTLRLQAGPTATPGGPTATPIGPTPTPSPVICSSAPRSFCRSAGERFGSALIVRDVDRDRRDVLKWIWRRGAAVSLADLGNPESGGTDYALCVYDETAGVPSLRSTARIPAGGTCGRRPCWRAWRRGYVYNNRDATPDGIRVVVLRAGEAGRSVVRLVGAGELLTTPSLPFLQDSRVRVQLVNDAGTCWEGIYSTPARRSSERLFVDWNG